MTKRFARMSPCQAPLSGHANCPDRLSKRRSRSTWVRMAMARHLSPPKSRRSVTAAIWHWARRRVRVLDIGHALTECSAKRLQRRTQKTKAAGVNDSALFLEPQAESQPSAGRGKRRILTCGVRQPSTPFSSGVVGPVAPPPCVGSFAHGCWGRVHAEHWRIALLGFLGGCELSRASARCPGDLAPAAHYL